MRFTCFTNLNVSSFSMTGDIDFQTGHFADFKKFVHFAYFEQLKIDSHFPDFEQVTIDSVYLHYLGPYLFICTTYKACLFDNNFKNHT